MVCNNKVNRFTIFVAVSGTEPDDNEAIPGERRRGEGFRAGAQVARARADAVPGAQARRGGGAAGGGPGGLALPEGAGGHHRPRPEQDQIAAVRPL